MLTAPGSYCQPCVVSSGEQTSSLWNIFAGVKPSACLYEVICCDSNILCVFSLQRWF